MDRRQFLTAAALLPAAGWLQDANAAPGTGPWDVKQLQKKPAFEITGTEQVREGDQDVSLSSVYYSGEPWMGKPTRVFGYYARPAKLPEKKLPAMVLVHGGGGTAFPEWARLWAARGYAALAMDLSGSGPGRQRLPDGGPDQGDEWKFRRLKDGVKNAWSYHSVAAVIQGGSVLAAMPEVDRGRMGITGISWGGYLTSIVMSLDDRLKAAAPVYGCGFLHENSAWLPIFAQLPEDERRLWVENFDPSSYLARCKTPALWVNGTNDFAYPMDSYQKSYRLPKAPRTLCVTVKMPHGHPQGWAPQEIHLFTDSVFRKKELSRALPLLGRPLVNGTTVRVPYDAETALLSASLHWTTDLGKPWQQREWNTATGKVLGLDAVEADLPTQKPCVYFMTLKESRGGIESTEHAELR